MKRPRHLSREERQLWDRVARSVDPIERARSAQAPQPRKPESRRPAKDVPPPDPAEAFPAFRIGSAAEPRVVHDTVAPLGDRLRAAPVRMDHKTYKRMVRGKQKPEGRIDLHGLTLDQAYPALISFILSAQQAEKRLVLVITGKGRRKDDDGPIPVRPGILRHQVPQWLRVAPLAQAVLEVRPAHLKHGGEGAYYVYLRKRR